MKKELYTALALTGLFMGVAAPVYALDPVDMIEPKLLDPLDANTEKQLIDIIKSVTLPDGAMYKQLLSIEPKGLGYALEMPVLDLDEEHSVPSYRILLTEESPIRNHKQYGFNMIEPKALLPKVSLAPVARPYTVEKFDYTARVVPDWQMFVQRTLNVQKLKTYNGWSVDKLGLDMSVKALADDVVKLDDTLTMEGLEYAQLPLIRLYMQQVGLKGTIPTARMVADDIERHVASPEGTWDLSVTGGKLLSLFMPFLQVTFDAQAKVVTTADSDLDTLRVDMEGRIFNLKNGPLNESLQQSLLEKWPDEITFKGAFIDISAVQLTQLLRLASEMHKTLFVTDDQKEQFGSQLQDFLPPLPVHVEALTIENQNYAIVVKGVLSEDGFSGTIGVNNFDLISPGRDKNDVTSGFLEVLRPYKDTARQTQDAKGRQMLMFDIQYSYKLGLFINKYKVSETGAMPTPENGDEVLEFMAKDPMDGEEETLELEAPTETPVAQPVQAAEEPEPSPIAEQPEEFNTDLFPEVEL